MEIKWLAPASHRIDSGKDRQYTASVIHAHTLFPG